MRNCLKLNERKDGKKALSFGFERKTSKFTTDQANPLFFLSYLLIFKTKSKTKRI
jgi:hypothetical protein